MIEESDKTLDQSEKVYTQILKGSEKLYHNLKQSYANTSRQNKLEEYGSFHQQFEEFKL